MDFAPSYRKPKLTAAKSAVAETSKTKLAETDALNLGQLVERVNSHIEAATERGSYGIQFKVPRFVGLSMFDPEEMLPVLSQYLRDEGGYVCEEYPPNVIHIRWDHLRKKTTETAPVALIQELKPTELKGGKTLAQPITTSKAPAKPAAKPKPKAKVTGKQSGGKSQKRKPAKNLVAVR